VESNDGSYPAGIRVAKRDHKETMNDTKVRKNREKEKDKKEGQAKKGICWNFDSILK
jgi:hypothetical protein